MIVAMLCELNDRSQTAANSLLETLGYSIDPDINAEFESDFYVEGLDSDGNFCEIRPLISDLIVTV